MPPPTERELHLLGRIEALERAMALVIEGMTRVGHQHGPEASAKTRAADDLWLRAVQEMTASPGKASNDIPT